MPVADDLKRLQRELDDLRLETRLNAGALAGAVRKSRLNLAIAEQNESIRKLRPPTSLLDWSPRPGKPTEPDVQNSLLDRLRRGTPVADSLGNTQAFIGQQNLVADSPLEGVFVTTTVLTTSDQVIGRTYVGDSWRARKSAGTAATCRAVGDRRDSVLSHYYSSGTITLEIQPTGAGTHLITVSSLDIDLTVSPLSAMPYFVGAWAITTSGNTMTGITGMRARVRLWDNSIPAYVEDGDWFDVLALPDGFPVTISAAMLTSGFSSFEQMELHLEFEVTGTGATGEGRLLIGEPRMHFALSPDPQSFTPALGTWHPGLLASFADASAGTDLIVSQLKGDTDIRFRSDAGGALSWGPGNAARDARIHRTAAKTLTVDDNAGGALTLLDLKASSIAIGGRSVSAIAPIRRVYTATGANTWTKPTGLSHIEVEVVGAGGGGGGAALTAAGEASAGGGGAGGGGGRKLFTAADLAGAASFTATVGTGGSAGAATPTAGGTGGASTFAGTGITTVQGNGGTGGGASAASAGNTTAGGGTGGTASGGDVNVSGGDGGKGGVRGGQPSTSGVGGGSAFGLGTNTQPAQPNSAGNAGTLYGGGGSGGANNASQAAGRAGGLGANGVVIVTEYYAP